MLLSNNAIKDVDGGDDDDDGVETFTLNWEFEELEGIMPHSFPMT